MSTDANSTLLFLLTLIWTLVILIFLLIVISLFVRYLIKCHGLRTSKHTKYSVVQIEEGSGDITLETINSENLNAGEGDHKTEENRMSQENDKCNPESKDKKDEEKEDISNGTKINKDPCEEKGELNRKRESIEGREKETELFENVSKGKVKDTGMSVSEDRVTSAGKGDPSPHADTSHLSDAEDVSPRYNTDRQRELDKRCNMMALKDSEFSKSTEEALARPVPTPRRKLKPGESQSELSSSKASLIDASEGLHSADEAIAKSENKGEIHEDIKRESASPRSNSPLWDDLESMFSLSKELAKNPLQPSRMTDICIPASESNNLNSCKEQHTHSSQGEINLPLEREQDTGNMQNDITLPSVQGHDRSSPQVHITTYPAQEQDKVNAENWEVLYPAQKNDGTTASDASTLTTGVELKTVGTDNSLKSTPEEANVHLESKKSDICASKLPPLPTSLPKRGRKSKKAVPVGDSKTCTGVNQQDKLVGAIGGMLEVQSKQHPDKPTNTPKPGQTQLISPNLAKRKDSSLTPLNRSRKGSKKPSNPPPMPPLSPSTKENTTMTSLKKDPLKSLQAPATSLPPLPKEKGKPSGDAASLLPKVSSGSRKIAKPVHPPPTPPKKTLDPSPQVQPDTATAVDAIESAAVKSANSSFSFTQIPGIPVESQQVYDEIDDPSDEIGDKVIVRKKLLKPPEDRGAVVQNANILHFQKQALRNVSLSTNQFVNPVFELTAGIQGKQQFNHSEGAIPDGSKDKFCMKPSICTSKKVHGEVQSSDFAPPKPARTSLVVNSRSNPDETTDIVAESSSSKGLPDAIHKGKKSTNGIICTALNNLNTSTSDANGSICSPIKTDDYITAVASTENASMYDIIPEVPDNELNEAHDQQLFKPPVPAKPKISKEQETAHLEDCKNGEKKTQSKPPVPKKPVKKT